MHSLEENISDLSIRIKVELRQIVTYSGIPIIEKMKFDHSEVIKSVQSDRMTKRLLTPKLKDIKE